ncbi:DNA-binding transcription factor cat8 [Sporothrix epigloea]|uniref:DNA-binding transcription factor cat8 n=1 Tax=Sporothrix epigloea TaxID=1892477 RepID=A0ABP0DEP2_9PEZI
MPGILPMKVIKVGVSSQSRIAQACDRCRSKKIRCDGIRPCCSQCANVGFECRTSDKLSRRAFPRGYTESLEERVRHLECEVRELKDLLDEKDEKIDMLSKMHGNQRRMSVSQNPMSPTSGSATSASSSPSDSHDSLSRKSSSISAGSLTPTSSPGVTTTASPKLTKDTTDPAAATKKDHKPPVTPVLKEDTFRVQASPLILGVENSDSYFMGPSSGRSFIDRCVNVYFQEWSPLFPILHRPAFLRIYDDFVSNAEKVKSSHKLAQLYLVFAIAALSSDQPDLEEIAACEQQWQCALDAILMENTILTLQCLVLAILYCSIRADYKRLQYYKGIAIGLSHRLGLHQSQKRFSFGALTIETRKKVFWTLYTLDCFSAAVLGLPRQLKDEDVHTEYPTDADDEYVTEKGFQPTLPGESTRLSAALALFRASRILSRVLDANYPADSVHELSLQRMASLDAELTEWQDSLPVHLTLIFRQERPSTDVTGNRSPLLSLVYYYIRTLIWRPAIGSSLGIKAASAVMTVSEAGKHMVQIIELLEERKMSFSLCMNKPDLLILCGVAVLYQSMDLKQDSKMMKDKERLVNEVIKITDRTKAPGCYDFKRIAATLVSVDDVSPPATRTIPKLSMTAPARRPSPSSNAQNQDQQKKLHQYPLGHPCSTGISEADLLVQQEKLRRMTMPVIGAAVTGSPSLSSDYHVRGRSSFDSPREHVQLPKQHRLSMSQMPTLSRAAQSQQQQWTTRKKNLDYLNMYQSPQLSPLALPRLSQAQYFQNQKSTGPSSVTPENWEALLSSLEGGNMNVYDAIYGGSNIGLSAAPETTPPSGTTASQSGDSWSPEPWDFVGFKLADLADLTGTTSHGGPGSDPPQSVLSFSDESMSSVTGDELDLSTFGLGGLDNGLPFRNGNLLSAGRGTGPENYVADTLDSKYLF